MKINVCNSGKTLCSFAIRLPLLCFEICNCIDCQVDSTTIPHQHLLHSKSPPFDSLFGTPVKASREKVVNCPPRRWFPPFISFAPLTWVFFGGTGYYHRRRVVLERSRMFSGIQITGDFNRNSTQINKNK
jgi:hypothetical protein